MIVFEVPDMTCSHCVATITSAVERVDPGARVRIDLAAHRVAVEPVRADTEELADAIRRAGYSPAAHG